MKQTKQIVLSGIQPSGELHIGNYLGSLKNFVELQNKYQCYFFLATYHSITEDYNPKEKKQDIFDLMLDFLAAGLDPKKCIIFNQIDVPECTELAWIFNTITPIAELLRMTQFKDKAGIHQIRKLSDMLESKKNMHNNEVKTNYNEDTYDKFRPILEKTFKEILKEIDFPLSNLKVFQSKYEYIISEFIKIEINQLQYERKKLAKDIELNKKSIELLDYYFQLKQTLDKISKTNTGLLDYPVLQAADILLYHAQLIPVGQDQIQHVEITRDIARHFNNKFGQYFIEPKPLLTKIPKVMSLLEPEKKMSKSAGPGHYIAINDEPEAIHEKLKRAVTGTGTEETLPAGAQNLMALLAEFGTPKQTAYFKEHIKNKTIRYSELKETLAKDISEYFVDFRKKRKQLEKKPQYVAKVLKDGASKARKIAQKTIKEVKNLIGVA